MPGPTTTQLQPREAALILRVLRAGERLVAEDVKSFCEQLGLALPPKKALSTAASEVNSIDLSPGLLAKITSFIFPTITLEYTR